MTVTTTRRRLRAGAATSRRSIDRHRRARSSSSWRWSCSCPLRPGVGEGPPGVLRRRRLRRLVPTPGRRVLARREDPAVVDPADPRSCRCSSRSPAAPAAPALFPLKAFAVIYTDVMRGIPVILLDLPDRLRRARPSGCRATWAEPRDLGHGDARAVVLGVRRRDHPRRDRRGPREPTGRPPGRSA